MLSLWELTHCLLEPGGPLVKPMELTHCLLELVVPVFKPMGINPLLA